MRQWVKRLLTPAGSVIGCELPLVEKVLCQKLSGQLANINETSVTRCGPSFETKKLLEIHNA